MSADHVHAHDDPTTHHEDSDVNLRAIFGFGVVLVGVCVVSYIIVYLLMLLFGSMETKAQPARQYPLAAEQQNRLPAEPRLQTSPRQDLRDLRAAEDATLNSYGWVDRNAGVVRIPITEAMKLTIQRGLPARQEAVAPAGAVTTGAASGQETPRQGAASTESRK